MLTIINDDHFEYYCRYNNNSKNDFIELAKVIAILSDLSKTLDRKADDVYYYSDLNTIRQRLENEMKNTTELE
ncbi:MAG: hypothetical protein LBP63_05525 [Prevotellaceae bacterium]|nr:hypothetical protein [Prevotellaceae bacterium]